MPKSDFDVELAVEQEPAGRPVPVRQASRKKSAVRSRKSRRRSSSPGGIHQRANKRISW
jgi:hypothetical protein